ncbi:hypothetical protein [Pedobacter gandavensis]|uniref:hypothetical protein n=1 Tax=Pedobacter gandavensis TaxID=2679963 RepID=UPI00292E876F|nr:hypothetical protein [Pedobacter gandavensis]
MKTLHTLLSLIFFCTTSLFAQQNNAGFITADIDNFWIAYDKIINSKDSIEQYNYLNKLYLEKGTPGLKAIMEARNYTAKSYIDAINTYPLFWNSIRKNTLKAKSFAKGIATDVAKMKKLYPELKPANVYFTIGALRTSGTTLNGMVLIGAELVLTDSDTETKELMATLPHLKAYFDSKPIQNTGFLNVHEYVHTQQKTTIANNLLAQCTMEGVAEFLAVKATGKTSPTPAIAYGKALAEKDLSGDKKGKTNEERINAAFSAQMFNASNGFWLYSNMQNQFEQRDLGYYVGYAICEKYYEKASNKRLAIKEMIELDYNDSIALAKFVDLSGYFSKPVETLRAEYNRNRPGVTGIKQLKNYATDVDPAITQLTIEFSKPMNKRRTGFELGPSGESKLLFVKSVTGFPEDGKSVTIEIALLPGKEYEIIVSDRFTDVNSIALKPYLIKFKTAEK